MEQNNHGGKRTGSGRPIGDPTELINFRVKTSLKKDAKIKHKKGLNKLFVAWLRAITYP
jgi:hypothetical protein